MQIGSQVRYRQQRTTGGKDIIYLGQWAEFSHWIGEIVDIIYPKKKTTNVVDFPPICVVEWFFPTAIKGRVDRIVMTHLRLHGYASKED